MSTPLVVTPDIERLRRRHGRKWSHYPPEVLPAWLADMDFLVAPVIREALAEALKEGDLGYGPAGAHSGVPQSFARWAQRRWQWRIEPDAVMVMPDVVSGLANCIEALTEPGESVLVPTPVYPPFLSGVLRSGRRLVTVPIGAQGIDIAALAEAVTTHHVRMLMLCNPHNPTGRCFTRSELAAIANLSARHDLLIVSDEVHADLVYPGGRHVPLASLDAKIAARTVTLNSASKAFNVAGLRCAVCVATDPALRRRLYALPPQRWTTFSSLGVRAALAAWSDEGERWLLACIEELARRRARLLQRLSIEFPAIRCREPEASYLAWLDCRGLGLSAEPAEFFFDHAQVALSAGHEFGEPGAGHARLNFATSQDILDQILDRMLAACEKRGARVGS